MAAEVPADDDDAWLYGDNNAEEQRKEEINAIFDRATEDVVPPGEETIITTNSDGVQLGLTENEGVKIDESSEKPQENEEEKDSGEEDDSDDDDIQVTIGDIKPTASAAYPYGGAPVNLNIKRGAPFVAGASVASGAKTKGIDLDTVGLINGVSMYEFNLDTIEDKPWRKPGADITDYFNYGFNEDSWRAYCEKQRKLRLDNNMVSKVVQLVPGGKDQQIPIATVNENSKYSGVGVGAKKAGPPPGRRMSGSIDVICGANSSRRSLNAKENVIQVIGAGYDSTVSAGLPPTHLPPPFIPPNLSVPPPGLPPGIPPPAIPPFPGHHPIPDIYGNPMFTQPPPLVPVESSNSQYDEQYFTGNSRNFEGNSESQHSWANSPHRERDRDRDRDREGRRERDKERERYWEERRSRGGPEDDYKRREREEYERRHYREYRDSRRDKDRYERDYEERDYREKDSREKDRERRHRDRDKERDDRHKERSSRRRHHEEEDHHSSRHKHKKSKRDKEDSSNPILEGAESTQPDVEEEEEK